MSFPRQVDYIGIRDRIEARKSLGDATKIMDRLEDLGFVVRLERHAGMWLVHFRFPRLRLVSGHALVTGAKGS